MLFYEKVMKTYTYGILNRNHYELEIISWGLLCEEGWGEFPKALNVYDCKRGYCSSFAEIVRSLIFAGHYIVDTVKYHNDRNVDIVTFTSISIV